MLKVRLLGQFDVQLYDEPVEIPSRPVQSLLAYLILHAGQTQRRERLAGLLWPASSESNARGNLRHTLWRVRKAIGADYILADKVGVTFSADAAYWLDAAAIAHQPGAASSTDELMELVALYTGELLPGFYDEWIVWERERVRAVHEDRVQALLERLIDAGRWREARQWAERWIVGGEVPEPAFRALMRAHAELGDQAGMAAVYHRCVEALEQEIGVAPAQETVQLFQRLSKGETPPRSPIAPGKLERRSNLPTPPTPFVGREALLAEVANCLQESACRLLTLVGPGGSGKTRLAWEAAAGILSEAQVGEVEHGVYFVHLAPLESVEAIVPTVAQAVNFSFYEGVQPRQQLLNFLQAKSMLLVLDNFEHLLDGVRLVTEILETAPRVKVLATSRANLNVQGERLFHVGGMDVPEGGERGALTQTHSLQDASQYGAVQLFLERARWARWDLAIGDRDWQDIVSICQLVDGMPLGIELAAAWIGVLPLGKIAGQIRRSLDFLESDLSGVPARQRSMRAVFDHSWKLISQQEREVMQGLSVFSGGFTGRAAQAVTGATMRTLKGLMDKSLLQRAPDPSATDGSSALRTGGRYQMHELLRQYAADKLGRSPVALTAARDRHCAYYADFLHERLDDILTDRQREATQEIAAELENVRAAWRWAVQQKKVQEIHKSSETFTFFFQIQSRFVEGAEVFGQAARSLEAQKPGEQRDLTLAQVLVCQGWLCLRLGQLETAKEVLEKSRAIFHRLGDPFAPGVGSDPRTALGILSIILGDYAEATRLGEQALMASEAQGDKWNLITSHWVLANVALAQGEFQAARRSFRQAHTIAKSFNERWFRAYILNDLGSVARALGDFEEAKGYYEASYAIEEELDSSEGLGLALNHLGEIALLQKDVAQAEALYRQSLAMYEEIGDRGGLATALKGLGDVALASGELGTARQRLQRALQIATEMHFIPLTLAVAISVGELLLQCGREKRAAELLTLSAHHPSVDREAEGRARGLLARCKAELPPAALAHATAREITERFEATVASLQTELTALEAGVRITPSSLSRHTDQGPVEALTARESQILRLLAQGLSNKEIAEKLVVTVGTVKWYNNQIYSKLDVRSRTQAVARAREMRLLF